MELRWSRIWVEDILVLLVHVVKELIEQAMVFRRFGIVVVAADDNEELLRLIGCGEKSFSVRDGNHPVRIAVADKHRTVVVPYRLGALFPAPCRWFWVALSIAALTVAGTALLAASVCAVAACLTLPRESPLMVWTALAVLRMLVSPPLAAAFALAGIVAPSRTSRWSLLAAAGIEGTVAAYAVLRWFAGCCFV